MRPNTGHASQQQHDPRRLDREWRCRAGRAGTGRAHRRALGQVVMSLARGRQFPYLTAGPASRRPAGDISVELEVTTDLTNAELQLNNGKGCYSKPDDYPPTVTASVILASDETGTVPLRECGCGEQVRHRQPRRSPFCLRLQSVAGHDPTRLEWARCRKRSSRQTTPLPKRDIACWSGLTSRRHRAARHGRHQRRPHPRPASSPDRHPRIAAAQHGAENP